MFVFRKMDMEDLHRVYQNQSLRPLITVMPKGEKFAILIDDNGKLIGGASGYKENKGAVVQKILVEGSKDSHLLLDGLIRSLIHILERDGIRYLFISNRYSNALSSIGYTSISALPDYYTCYIGKEIIQDIGTNDYVCIDIIDFFEKGCPC